MRMRAISVVLLGVVGCASSDGALVKRDEVRTQRAAIEETPLDPAYRAKESVRGVRWGMTQDEVIAVKGEPEQRTKDVLTWSEALDSTIALTNYDFLDDHLAQIRSRFDSGPEQGKRLERALTLKYGAPHTVFDKAQTNLEAVDKVRQWQDATILLGWWWPEHEARLALTRTMVENAQKPARDVSWGAPESHVHLVTLDGGSTLVAWSSRRLGPKLTKRQFGTAGLKDLADAL